VSDRESGLATTYERQHGVSHGIHVFRDHSEPYPSDKIIIPVYAKFGDFVGASRSEAVFTKVRIDTEELRAAMRKFYEGVADNRFSGLKNVKSKRRNYLRGMGPIVKYTTKK
jgi:hypothetical protein